MRTRVLTVTCLNCKDEMYSRSRHDVHYCYCGEIAVDGGFDYLRFTYKKDYPTQRIRYINASKEEIGNDQGLRRTDSKFGWIKKVK